MWKTEIIDFPHSTFYSIFRAVEKKVFLEKIFLKLKSMDNYKEQIPRLKAYIKVLEKDGPFKGKKEELEFQRERLEKLINLTKKE